MSFDYRDYLYVAQELTRKTPTRPASEEARLRSAISRAYYAVFLTAKDYLEQNSSILIPDDGTVHSFIRIQFQARGRTDGKFRRIAIELGILHELRKKADYGALIENISLEVDKALQRAQDALDKLGEL
jgi:uncharacterized protein (UPF0332 family)